MEKGQTYYATGRRKTSVAKTWMMPGSGTITINDRPFEDYVNTEAARLIMIQPLALTNNQESYDIRVKVSGGGMSGQVGAIRHGITRALMEADPDLRQVLKRAGFVKRDPRQKERKKYGQRGARARFQFSKR